MKNVSYFFRITVAGKKKKVKALKDIQKMSSFEVGAAATTASGAEIIILLISKLL